MSLEIYVDAYSGYKANERPRLFSLDEDLYDIEAVEQQWRTPEAIFFKVRTTDGKHYLLRYEEGPDQWTLQSGFDGAELFARPSIELVTVEQKSIRDAESRIVGCERCRPVESELLFDSVLADVLEKHGAFEFVLAETAKCPKCRGEISEKTLVVPLGGIEVDTHNCLGLGCRWESILRTSLFGSQISNKSLYHCTPSSNALGGTSVP